MFDSFINLFNIILYKPLFNALIFLYECLPGHDFGIAVIVLTLTIRLVLYPSTVQSIKSQKALAQFQPKIQEIQKKYKDDKQKQAQAIMEFYKKEGINPLSGCLPLLIQLPILIALYRVFWRGLESGQMVHLYSFVPDPGIINPNFLGLINLSQPSAVLAVLAGILQFFQTKMLSPKTESADKTSDFAQTMQKQMIYFFPAFTVFILLKLPAAIGLYWIIISMFSIIQQYFILKPRAVKI